MMVEVPEDVTSMIMIAGGTDITTTEIKTDFYDYGQWFCADNKCKTKRSPALCFYYSLTRLSESKLLS